MSRGEHPLDESRRTGKRPPELKLRKMPKPPRRATKRERLDAARRVRAGVIGLLECCRCECPLVQHATSTRHDERCPAHGMIESAIAAGSYVHFEYRPSP